MQNKTTDKPIVSSNSVSILALRQYLKMADRCDINYQPLLLQEGLLNSTLADNTSRIPLKQFETILQRLISNCEDTLFGLHTSAHIEPAFYSVQGYICLNCANLREVLVTIPLYEKIVGDMGVSDLIYHEDKTLLRWQSQLLHPEVKRHVRENVISSWLRFTQQFLNIQQPPVSIWFEHDAPESSILKQEYIDIFRCPVKFSQEYSGIWLDNESLDLRIEQADENLLRTLLEHASNQLQDIEKDQTTSDQVKSLLKLTLNHQLPNCELIADKLGISVRTLQRKLGSENTTYKALLNELRQELALHYVKNSRLSYDTIAAKLGFSEPRSFYRSFKQWTGSTANTYREQINN
jgi:AraC-like DNA-binding protein